MKTISTKKSMLLARIMMSFILIVASAVHFVFTEDMTMMFPDFIPLKYGMVYLAGMIELVAAFGLLIPRYRLATAWLLIAFFFVILPANMYAGIKQIIVSQANFNDPGLRFLWFRIPIQLLFMVWVYYSCIRTTPGDLSVETADQ